MPTVTIEKEIQIDIEVWCGNCGHGLCSQTKIVNDNVTVGLCENCISEIKKDYETRLEEMDEELDRLRNGE